MRKIVIALFIVDPNLIVLYITIMLWLSQSL